MVTNPADSYYNVLGPAPIGLIGMLPMLAAAVWLTLREILKKLNSSGEDSSAFAAAAALQLRRSFSCGLLLSWSARKKEAKNLSKSVDKEAGVWYYT